MITPSRPRTSSAPAGGRADGRREAGPRMRRLAVLAWRAWGRYRAARALRALSPEMLKDIGVQFCEIETVVRDGRARTDRRSPPRGGRS
jgi:uncharacterized protein YjiS (DUF1127 family)